VVILEGLDLCSDLIDADVVTDTGVWFGKAVHVNREYVCVMLVLDKNKWPESQEYKVKIIGS
jgi:hypothetical protein